MRLSFLIKAYCFLPTNICFSSMPTGAGARSGFEQVMEAEVGMMVASTIAKIRRAYFVHGQPTKAFCRELGVSRKEVRKVVRSEATKSDTSERRSRF
jgi:hypothetical protein